ncbi:MAG: SOS response-associated peptidase [Tepidisphaeraceae bacterium]
MCGRYTVRRIDLIRHAYAMNFTPLFEEFTEHPRYNVAPSQFVPVVRMDDGRRQLTAMKWGLIPSWTKGKPKLQPINARAETLRTSPMFRQALVKRRCLMPADGFYEWQGAKPPKQPWFFHRPGDRVFAFAAIWERWYPVSGPVTRHADDPEPPVSEEAGSIDAEPIETCCLITTQANDLMRPIHQRMPVILDESTYDAWLDPAATANTLKQLLQPTSNEELETWQVSTAVNNVKTDGPDLVEPV